MIKMDQPAVTFQAVRACTRGDRLANESCGYPGGVYSGRCMIGYLQRLKRASFE
jgi:hypothetical protein